MDHGTFCHWPRRRIFRTNWNLAMADDDGGLIFEEKIVGDAVVC